MAYIYKITNDINGKVYIGKTERTISERFSEHCRNSHKTQNESRPLYRAMNKYGVDHFHIEEIEQTNNPEEREIYWIEYYSSFKSGYNATVGGDGRKYLDYDLVVATYNQVNSIAETANLLNIHVDSVSDILRCRNVKVKTSQEVNLQKFGTVINQYDLQGNYIQSFPSVGKAVIYLGKNAAGAKSHIGDVCKGKRKTAYGYIWKYAEEK